MPTVLSPVDNFIKLLQEARAAGCRTSVEAERFIEQKRKREAEENARKAKENSQTGPSGKFLQRANHLKGELDNSPRGGPPGSGFDDWNVNGFPGADLLSESVSECYTIFNPRRCDIPLLGEFFRMPIYG